MCEGNCVIEQSGHGTVTIGAVEKYITDTAWERGWVKPLTARRERGQSVGIIGAGPAGMAAAEELRRKGYDVTIYDRHDRAGGLLIYGIPNFKLEKDVVARRVKRLEDGGIVFKLNFDVGRDATPRRNCARSTMRCSSAPASTSRARSRCRARGWAASCPRSTI